MGVLVREVGALYAALRRGPAVAAARAADPVRRLRRLAARLAARGGAGRRQLAYWRERLAGAAGRPRAADRPAAAGACRASRGAARRCACGRGSRRRSARSARRQGATLFMVLLAAFQALLARATPGRRTSSSARRSPAATRQETRGADRLLRQHAGAARPISAGDPTFAELLGAGARDARSPPTPTRTCRSRSWSTSCAPERSLAPHAALPGHARAAERAAARARRCRARGLGPPELDDGPREVRPARCALARSRRALAGIARVQPRPVRRARRSTAWRAHLENAARRRRWPRRSCALAELPLLARGGAPAAPGGEWNDTAASCARRRCLHELIAAQAAADARRGGAGRSRARGLTYGELERRANRLAHRLRRLGVGAGGAGRRLRRALARAGGGAARRPQGRAAPTCRSTPRYPRERLALHAGRSPARRCSSPRTALAARSLPAGAGRGCVLPRRRAAPEPERAAGDRPPRSSRGAGEPRPTSSTPRARPGGPRGR